MIKWMCAYQYSRIDCTLHQVLHVVGDPRRFWVKALTGATHPKIVSMMIHWSHLNKTTFVHTLVYCIQSQVKKSQFIHTVYKLTLYILFNWNHALVLFFTHLGLSFADVWWMFGLMVARWHLLVVWHPGGSAFKRVPWFYHVTEVCKSSRVAAVAAEGTAAERIQRPKQVWQNETNKYYWNKWGKSKITGQISSSKPILL